jgi:hypothetical protein
MNRLDYVLVVIIESPHFTHLRTAVYFTDDLTERPI